MLVFLFKSDAQIGIGMFVVAVVLEFVAQVRTWEVYVLVSQATGNVSGKCSLAARML